MMMVSDNSSTNIVIQAVGMDKVNARMAALGLGDIRLRRLMMDAAAVKRGDENIASPQSLAKVAELLWRGEGLKPESRETALGMLKLVSGSIRQAVPARVPVFAKTGSLDGVRTEAGRRGGGRPAVLDRGDDDLSGPRTTRAAASSAR